MAICLKGEVFFGGGGMETVKMQFRRMTILSKSCSGIYLLDEPRGALKKYSPLNTEKIKIKNS